MRTPELQLRYILKKSTRDQNCSTITLYFRYDGQRVFVSTRKLIPNNKWDDKLQVIKGRSHVDSALNDYLDLFKSRAIRIYNSMIVEREIIDLYELRSKVIGTSAGAKNKLLELFEYHNTHIKGLVGLDITESTYKKYKTIIKKVKRFIRYEYKKDDIFLHQLRNNFLVKFEHFLKTKDGISHNTVMKYIRHVKKVINFAIQNEWMDKNPFSNFRCRLKETKIQFLTREELDAIINKTFLVKRLAEIRDIFVFCCHTGYAYADVEALTPDNVVRGIDGKKWIHTNRKKTKIKANVPLLSQAIEIIERYENHPVCVNKGKLLPVISNQKMNAYLKEIADLCGISKKMTTHVARHTFATTVLLTNGVSMETVSKLLGHASITTTQIYAKVVETRISDEMSKLEKKINKKPIASRQSVVSQN